MPSGKNAGLCRILQHPYHRFRPFPTGPDHHMPGWRERKKSSTTTRYGNFRRLYRFPLSSHIPP
jgi:hypothetical protein